MHDDCCVGILPLPELKYKVRFIYIVLLVVCLKHTDWNDVQIKSPVEFLCNVSGAEGIFE